MDILDLLTRNCKRCRYCFITNAHVAKSTPYRYVNADPVDDTGRKPDEPYVILSFELELRLACETNRRGWPLPPWSNSRQGTMVEATDGVVNASPVLVRVHCAPYKGIV
jgi:hypothetical protein